MNRNLYFKEIKRNRVRFIIWTSVLVLFIIFTISVIPSMVSDREKFESFLKLYPEAIKKSFGMDIETWSNPLGIYTTYHGFYAYLLGGIFAITFGMEIISKEENRRTAEFLLTRPLSRPEIVASKLLAFFAYIFLFNIALLGAILIGLTGFLGMDFDLKGVLSLSFFSLLLTSLFGALGLFISLLKKRGRSPVGLGIGLVIVAYIVDALAKAFEKISFLRWLTPFQYAEIEVARGIYGFEWWRLVFLLGFTSSFILLTFLLYRKKDIYV